MTFRTDVSVDWFVSPRIITVAAPSTEITIQDLLDTCRELEDDIQNMVFDPLASAAGKENLGGGVKVGITLTLLNAVLAFEARPGPTYTQCRVSGGNLVAVDGYGGDISPIYPTAFTQVLTTSSSSATLQELQDIQYSSFDGGVTVNLLSPYSGTTYPVGTPRQPVNNFTDALVIANERGFIKIYIEGNATVDSGLDYSNRQFYGQGDVGTHLTIDSAAQVSNCSFFEATISGTLDGGAHIKNCTITDLHYINGYVEFCVLEGLITIGGDAGFYDCSAGFPSNPPILDFEGNSAELVTRSFDGYLTLRNKTQPDICVIHLEAGELLLENTVTAGNIRVEGVGVVHDNSNGAIVNADYLINPPNITKNLLQQPLASYVASGNVAEALANSGLTPEQAKQLLMIFINSL